ncbi:MAG: nitrophenyl compound nitroreductase subunit ArsF family protein [Candidatus Krumholzibacteriia bacterium]
MRPHRGLAVTFALATLLAGAAPAAAAPVTVYYLHGTVRCVTCIALEDVTGWTVRDAFGDLLAEGLLDLRTVNYDLPENAHFLADFDLEVPGVVLAASAGDSLRTWKRLDRTWELSELPADLEKYIVEETRAFLRANLGAEYAP